MSDKGIRIVTATARFYSESNLQPLYTPSHEFLLGLNLGTKIDESQPTYEILDSDHLSELISSNQVDYNTPIVFNGEKTCYGRLRVSQILRYNLSGIIGDSHITSDNIIDIMIFINDEDDDRLNKIKGLADFGEEVVRYIGISSLTLNDLYVELDRDLYDEIKSTIDDPTLSKELKLLRVNELYSKFLKSYESRLTTKARERIETRSRIKLKQVTDLVAASLYITSDGLVSIDDNSIYDGLTRDEYITKSETNRNTLAIKQSGVVWFLHVKHFLHNAASVFCECKASNCHHGNGCN
jgi:hypothetical protein